MTTSRPELILMLNQVGETDVRTEEELLRFLQERAPDLDEGLLHRVISFAIDRGILHRAGKHVIRRHSVTESIARAFESDSSKREMNGDIDPSHLAFLIRALPEYEQRLKTVEHQVAALRALQDPATGTIHWLQLHPARIPRPIYEVLRQRALNVVGAHASETTVATQIVLIAAQILQQALLPGERRVLESKL